jgi:hypothetical protein
MGSRRLLAMVGASGQAKRPAWITDALVLVVYLTVSIGYFGVRLLPHPGRVFVGKGQDTLIYIWSFAWWPHAIGAGTNPFVTHAVYAPQGINLAWTPSIPGLALPLTPVTLLFGPVVSYNVVAVLLPAIAAWTAFLLCRELTGSTWASLIGGYLFGFSSYVVGQQTEGHVNLTGIFVVPLIGLVVTRYLKGSSTRRRLAWQMTALIAVQLWISGEVALTVTFTLAVCLALGLVFGRGLRPRLRSALGPIAIGCAAGIALGAPFLYYALSGFQSQTLTGAKYAVTDAANLVVSTHSNQLLGDSFRQIGDHFDETEADLYLGWPAILIVGLYAWRAWRTSLARFLLAALGLAVLIALGTELVIDGRTIVALPWKLIASLPLIDNVTSTRFAVFAELAVAVIVALWIAVTPGRIYRRPFVLPVLAVAALVPALALPIWRQHPPRPAFFSQGLYRTCGSPGQTLLVFPFGRSGDSMLWQAEDKFRFRLAEGALYGLAIHATPVSAFDKDSTVQALLFSQIGRVTMDRLLAFAAEHGVDRVVTVAGSDYPSAAQLRRFGPVEKIGGVLVAPACNQPSLRTRNLQPYVDLAARQEDSNLGYCWSGYFYTLPAYMYPAGVITGAKRAAYIDGYGLGCTIPPNFKAKGYAPQSLGVPGNHYIEYGP